MLPIFTGAIFLSAALLFLVQPMVAKLILPLLGGTPAVWNTCMLFFQTLLLAGYAYSHLLSSRIKKTGVQVAIHAAVCAAPVILLPIALPADARAPSDHSPVFWLLGTLLYACGAPFFVLSTTGPLLQSWFSTTTHKQARDPYFLYAASNAGSLLALVGYPLLVEPSLLLKTQTHWWAYGYGALILLLVGAGVLAAKNQAARQVQPVTAEPAANTKPVATDSKTVGLWVLLAFAPSSLMLGATTYISTDLAAFPLLWVIPLTIYLLSMIIAFSKAGPWFTKVCSRAAPVAALAVATILFANARQNIGLIAGCHLICLFVCATACHGRLAAMRPDPSKLTAYFLWMSVGGALGGLFNALVAPLVFKSIAEYPVAVVLSAALSMGVGVVGLEYTKDKRRTATLILDVSIPLGIVALFETCRALMNSDIGSGWPITVRNVVGYGVPAVLCYITVIRPVRFVAGIAAALIVFTVGADLEENVLHRERTFFGVLIVKEDVEEDKMRTIQHGTTIHGRQSLIPEYTDLPTSYYHRSGPLGDIMTLKETKGTLRTIGALGLGAGTVAAYAPDGGSITFYEIDKSMVDIASNADWFTYISRTRQRATVNFRMGDGRHELDVDKDARYDVLIIDAFSSDAIPVHLLTAEAVDIYMNRLAEGGILAVHLSNRHLDLTPVIGQIAKSRGLAMKFRHDTERSMEEHKQQKLTSLWAAVARKPEDLADLPHAKAWIDISTYEVIYTSLWTDDFSAIWEIMKF